DQCPSALISGSLDRVTEENLASKTMFQVLVARSDCAANLDTHADPDGLLRTKAFLSVGHDEYWTRQMFDHVKRARDAGVDLLFLSGNAVSGEVFLSTSSDGRPNRVMGRTKDFTDEQLLMGAASYGVGLGDWMVTNADHWIYATTGLRDGDRIPHLVGWEYHGHPLREDPTLVVAGKAEYRKDREQPRAGHAATIYDGPKGNFVFNAGTCWWSMALAAPPGFQNPPDVDFSEPDPRVQQMTKNLFERVLTRGESVEAALRPASGFVAKVTAPQ
ncbi:MAG: N,N-dimethylformamidase beta subunit family domain-containing protein, partial [Opitutaceae bacterium]